MSLRILLSGGTGFLGRHMTPRLERLGPVTRISRSRADCLNADLTRWDGGIDPLTLRGRFDLFVHMAGLYNLRVSETEALRQNVAGTHAALNLAEKAEIPRFVHVSTVAVAMGWPTSPVGPDDLDTSQRFPDAYALSKAHAEEMVRLRAMPASRLILRPGILVGDRDGSPIPRIDGPYFVPRALERLRPWLSRWPGPLLLPGRPEVRLPVLPVDVAADAMTRLIETFVASGWAGTRSFHVAPTEGLPLEMLYRSCLERMGIRRTVRLLSRVPAKLLGAAVESLAQLPREETAYALRMPRLVTRPTTEILGPDWCPEFPQYEAAFWRGYETRLSDR